MAETGTRSVAFNEAHLRDGEAAPVAGYLNYVLAALTMSTLLILRRDRIMLAAVLVMLPVAIPLILVFLTIGPYGEDGTGLFMRLVERIHINTMAPLLALFFGTMLVAEDAESKTLSYLLVRPTPRSAWLIGRFGGSFLVTALVLGMSLVMTTAASTALPNLDTDAEGIHLLLHHLGVAALALLAYGGLTAFLGAMTKRPIVFGVLLIYGWQQMAIYIPGLVDFFTIQKYTDAILPAIEGERDEYVFQQAFIEYQKQMYYISPTSALMMLVMLIVAFITFTVIAVRWREYASPGAAGS